MKVVWSIVALAAAPTAADPLRVLVFGDSQGDIGPTWQELQDVLDSNGANATVVNKAVGGTTACGWANDDADAITTAARSAFGPQAAPDLVWYTAGANDLANDGLYHACFARAGTFGDATACVDAAVGRMMGCTTTLLESLWESSPNASVGMYNYVETNMDRACDGQNCLEASADFLGGDYCLGTYEGGSAPEECMLRLLEHWQTVYVDTLQAAYPPPRFTGMNLLGAVQAAAGVPGAAVGHLNVSAGGARCDWMTYCVHSTYGTAAADAIGAAWWDIWLAPILA